MQRERKSLQYRPLDKCLTLQTVVSSASHMCNNRNVGSSQKRIHNSNADDSTRDTIQNGNSTWNLRTGNDLYFGGKAQTLDMDTKNCLKFAAQEKDSYSLNCIRDDTRYRNGTKQNSSKLPENMCLSDNGKSRETKAMKQVISKTGRNNVEDFHFHRRENQMRVLSGNVEKVMSWFKLKNYFHIIFEATAILVDFKEGKLPREKFLVLRDEKTGPSLLVKFYEMDRKLPHFDIGAVVRCTGRLIRRNSLHAFKVEMSSEQENIQSQRLFLMSNLVADEVKTLYIKKEQKTK